MLVLHGIKEAGFVVEW